MSLTPPTDLPALDALMPQLPRMALRRMFQQGGAKEHRSYVLQLNAVRLSDLAVKEYELAREAILAFHAKKNIASAYVILLQLPDISKTAYGHLSALLSTLRRCAPLKSPQPSFVA